MTLEDLLECHPEEIEKLSDEELSKQVMKYWTVSRPSMATPLKKVASFKSVSPVDKERQMKLAIAMEQAKKMGIDLSKFKGKLK